MSRDFETWNNAAIGGRPGPRQGEPGENIDGRAIDRMPTDMLVRFRAAERARIRLRNARIWQTVRIIAIAGAAIGFVL